MSDRQAEIYRMMQRQGPGYTTWTFKWRERNGMESTVTFTTKNGEVDEAPMIARRHGWPGHNGSRWNYFKDDIRSLLSARAGAARF